MSLNKRTLPMRMSRANREEETDICPDAKKLKKKHEITLQREAYASLKNMRAANGGEAKYGDKEVIVKRYSAAGFGDIVTSRMLSYRYGREKKGLPAFDDDLHLSSVPDNVEIETTDSNDLSSMTDFLDAEEVKVSKGGRPMGSKNGKRDNKKQHNLQKIRNCVTLVAQEYQNEKAKCIEMQVRVPKGTFKSIATKISIAHDISPDLINFKTVASRIVSGNLVGIKQQSISPIQQIEPEIALCCEQLSNIGQPLDRKEVCSLASEMIKGTSYETKMKMFKEKRGLDCTNQILGTRWYDNFMTRYAHVLKRGRCKHKDIKRKTWCTKEHFTNMYDAVYEKMVEAKVAIKLEEEVMLDIDGNQTDDEEKQYRRKTKFILTKPEQVLFVDKTGCNTNQKDDGYLGGRLYVLSAEEKDGGKVGATTDIHFTVLCFTNGNRTPLMCAVILKSSKDINKIPLSWKFGIDIRKNLIDNTSEVEILKSNCSEGQAMCGGPKSYFNGKEIPCFVGASPKASITSELLAKMLEVLDSHQLFDRSDGSLPFLLLDGHQSRMQLSFMQYINEPSHRWMVCIGVPYGTHIWQVHDASSMNGSFKMLLNKSKMEYLKHRCGEMKCRMTYVIPLVSMSWEESFGRADRAKRAIGRRGWGPLNYILLDHVKLFRHDKQQKQICSNQQAIGISDDLIEINDEGPLLNSCLDTLIEKRLKCKEANKKHEMGKQQQKDKQEIYKKLCEMTTLASGSLAANNMYCISTDEILAAAIQRSDEKIKKNEIMQEKRDEAIAKQNKQFMAAYEKYTTGKKLLTTDLKLLLSRIKLPNDAPIASKYNDLKVQFEFLKHRLQQIVLPVDENRTNINVLSNNENNESEAREILASSDLFNERPSDTSTITSTSDRFNVRICNNTSSTSTSNTTSIVTNVPTDELVSDVVFAMCALSEC